MKKIFIISLIIITIGCTQQFNTVSCDNAYFTVSPIELSILAEIEPLGMVGGAGHTLPTDHVYFRPNSSEELVPVYSPGNITVTSITRVDYIETESPDSTRTSDYSINFDLCSEVHGYFIHIDELSSILEQEFAKSNCFQRDLNELGHGYCSQHMSVQIQAGEILGYVGGTDQFDLGVYDDRVTLEYANPSRYPWTHRATNTVCPFDYYPEEQQETYYDFFIAGTCGTIMMDVPGTLQGNWFFGTTITVENSFEKELALIYNTRDLSEGLISISGIIMDRDYRWHFTKTHNGTINRDFSEVTDNQIYCYEPSWNQYGETMQGSIIIQLIDDSTLQIEYKENQYCNESPTFTNPTIYNR